MPAAYISPVVIERGFTWRVDFNVVNSANSGVLISGYTAYLTASGLLISGTTTGTTAYFERTSAQTSAYNFDRIGYEVRLISGATAEKLVCGDLVLSTGIGI
jgi:hypothetical protein